MLPSMYGQFHFPLFPTAMINQSGAAIHYRPPILPAPPLPLHPLCTNVQESNKKRPETPKRSPKSTQKNSKENTRISRRPGQKRDMKELRRLQREAATGRERRRMERMNQEFERLRAVLPLLHAGRRLSKYDTLVMAQQYISCLDSILAQEQSEQPPQPKS